MEETLQFITQYGYLVVFFAVLIEQTGIPLPSNFVLIAGGAVAGSGELELGFLVVLATAAAIVGNTLWFYVGRARGYKILGVLCKISLEPAACVTNARMMFLRHGVKSLVAAKFVPGLSTFAQPLAGASGMSLGRFEFFNGIGTLLWSSVFLGLGYLFSDQLELVLANASSLGWWLMLIVVAGLAVYFGRLFILRRRTIRDLLMARITPDELKDLIESGEDVSIVDLREDYDFESQPQLIPKSVRMHPDELESRHEELPRDREIILCCL